MAGRQNDDVRRPTKGECTIRALTSETWEAFITRYAKDNGGGHDGEGDPDPDLGPSAAGVFAHGFSSAGDPGDEEDQRDGDDAVENGGEDQGFDRVHALEVQDQAD